MALAGRIEAHPLNPTRKATDMSDTKEQLTEDEDVALKHAIERATAGGDSDIAAPLKRLRDRLRPKPSLPERVYVSISDKDVADAKENDWTAVQMKMHVGGFDPCYTILPEFPDGIDTLAKLWSEHRVRIYPSISGAWIAAVRDELPEAEEMRIATADTMVEVIRAALTYTSNRKA